MFINLVFRKGKVAGEISGTDVREVDAVKPLSERRMNVFGDFIPRTNAAGRVIRSGIKISVTHAEVHFR